MKNNILWVMGAGLLLMAAVSCRKESDVLLSYDHADALAFNAADTSFAAKFQVIWNGMNQHYSIWDYEAEQGLDWDAVYEEYYPKFEALDRRGKNATVTDEELKELLSGCLGPLHDGHFHFDVKNHKTGNTVSYAPASDRNAQRDDYATTASFSPNLFYYADPSHGEVETDENGYPIVMEYSTSPLVMLNRFLTVPGQGYLWAREKAQELHALSSPTEMQAFQLEQLINFSVEFAEISGKPMDVALEIYNRLWLKYSFLNIPGFDYIDPAFSDKGIRFTYALLKGNIAYFYVSGFSMVSYLDEETSQTSFNMVDPAIRNHVQQMRVVWKAWFDTVQQLHRNGTLGGVILDVRGNHGGRTDDFQYFVGSLLPSGGLQFGYQRFKRGTGRYDYSPLMPGYAVTMKDPHETITEPVVLLCNCHSVSMAEMSTLGVKIMENGTVIGKRTWGGLCPLGGNEYNSLSYSGFIGVEGKTPVFGYVPMLAALTLDKKPIEGQGVTPDIDVDLDVDLFQATGQDTQLDRALQFLRSGQ